MSENVEESPGVVEYDLSRMTNDEIGIIGNGLAECATRLDCPVGANWLVDKIFGEEAVRREEKPDSLPICFHRIPYSLSDQTAAEILLCLQALATRAERISPELGRFLDSLANKAVCVCAVKLKNPERFAKRHAPPEMN